MLLLVVASAGWLLRGWYHLLGAPTSEPRVVIAAPLDSEVHLANGEATATRGTIRANTESSSWLLSYGLPLGFLTTLALVPVGRLIAARQVQ